MSVPESPQQNLYLERFIQLRCGVELDDNYVILGKNELRDGWKDAYTREIDPNDMFYAFSGMVTNVGAGYCGGLVAGTLAGSYQGLVHQQQVQGTMNWGGAWRGLLNQGVVTANLMANRLGAAAFCMGVVESGLRGLVMSQAAQSYQFKDYSEDDLWFFEKDSRKLAPVSACVVMPLLRYRQSAQTVLWSTALMAAAVTVYAHCWSAEKYFDIRRGWDTPALSA